MEDEKYPEDWADKFAEHYESQESVEVTSNPSPFENRWGDRFAKQLQEGIPLHYPWEEDAYNELLKGGGNVESEKRKENIEDPNAPPIKKSKKASGSYRNST